MSLAHRSRSTLSPWLALPRAPPHRVLVTAERRVCLLVEDEDEPVVDLHARVLAVELHATVTLEGAERALLERRRVRARAADLVRFCDVVCDQVALACHLYPGIHIAVTRSGDTLWRTLWQPLAIALAGTGAELIAVDDHAPLSRHDCELTKRARRLGSDGGAG
jgi:hypothetical protein